MDNRPSVYLLQKAETLGAALDFFIGDQGSAAKPTTERRLLFLAQIEFWDFEMDSLVYAFESFEDRARTWQSAQSVQANLHKIGVAVRYKSILRVRWSNNEDRYSFRRRAKIVAPIDVLNIVIEKWNRLVKLAEENHLDTRSDQYIKLGANILPNLDKYLKKRLVEIDDEAEPQEEHLPPEV